jgi:PAS domain S-box-containing protein
MEVAENPEDALAREQEARRRAEERLRLLLEGATDHAILQLDPSGTVTEWGAGAERLLGHTAAEALGRPFDFIFTPEDLERGRPARELEIAAAGGRAPDDNWLVRKDGSRLWVSGSTTALRGGANELIGYLKIVRDRTGAKQMEEALRQRTAQLEEEARRRDEFLAMLSHELRNPLAPVVNSLHVLTRRKSDDPATDQAVGVMVRQVGHMARLLDDLLDVARITQGKIQLRKERGDLAAAARHAAEAVWPQMNERRHDLQVSAPATPVPVLADATRLEQVLMNLPVNAAEYTPDGGQVALSVSRAGVQAVARVKDSGVGLDAAMLSRVFDLFAQADRSLDRATGGLGVGLTLGRGLVELHGGTVEAHSDGPGRGSEFVVRLPALADEAAAPPSLGAEATPAAPPVRVLAVDDNKDAADSLAVLLELYGHEVRAVYTGKEALAVAPAFRPQAVLLDLGLPDVNGVEIARRIRSDQALTRVPLIAMTGHSVRGSVESQVEELFERQLIKPVDPQDLLRVLGELVSRTPEQ